MNLEVVWSGNTWRQFDIPVGTLPDVTPHGKVIVDVKGEIHDALSHWLDVPREGFTDRINREELARMKRSREAKGVSSTFIVGHAGRSK